MNMTKQVRLIRLHDGKVLFEGEYVKYYPHPIQNTVLPYCSIFESYPAAVTSVQICKKIDEAAAKENLLACRLLNQGKAVGCYIPMTVVRSEQEADTKVNANYRGLLTVQNTLADKR